MTSETILGIDFGTTHSRVAVWRNESVEIIPDEYGNTSIPSYIYFKNENERLFGEDAYNRMSADPKNVVFDVKRLMGRKFSETSLETDLKRWPFKVVSNNKNNPVIEVEIASQSKLYTPEEIAAMMLAKMKSNAEIYLGTSVSNVVITVPAHFNDAQRRATKDAACIAGLNILRIINEPTAAAIAYHRDRVKNQLENILIFNFGGGTLDVTLLTVEDGIFEVKGTSGLNIGGEDFTNRMMEFVIEEIKKKTGDDDVNNQVKNQVKRACERAKCELSNSPQSHINIDVNGKEFNMTITRARFEQICQDLFNSIVEPIKQVLKDAKMNIESDIHEIILTGGSSQIPKVQHILSKFSNGKQLNTSLNPEEAIVVGATIQASYLLPSSMASSKLFDLLLLDVTPCSLGLESVGGNMEILIPRNSTIPCKRKEIFSTWEDNQTDVLIQIFEGEHPLTKFNRLLGTFQLEDIPPMPKQVPDIEVTFEIDANGMLNVSACEKSTGKLNDITISNKDEDRLTREDIERMMKEAEDFKKAMNTQLCLSSS